MVNYGESIKKPFTDLVKLIIGIILSIIPIVNITIVRGFVLESSGLGKTRPSAKMPEWKNWTYLFIKGLAATVIQVVYALPAIILLVAAFLSILGPLVAAGITPDMFVTADASTQSVNILANQWAVMGPILMGAVWAVPLLIIGGLLGLLAAYLTPIAVLHYMSKKRFSAGFELGAITKKAFTGKYFIVWLLTAIFIGVVSAILSIIPFIGPAIAVFITSVTTYSLFGQIYKKV